MVESNSNPDSLRAQGGAASAPRRTCHVLLRQFRKAGYIDTLTVSSTSDCALADADWKDKGVSHPEYVAESIELAMAGMSRADIISCANLETLR